MTTLQRPTAARPGPGTDRPTDPPTDAPTDPARPARTAWRDRLARLAQVTAAAAGGTTIPFGAPVSPMAVTRLLHQRPGGPAR